MFVDLHIRPLGAQAPAAAPAVDPRAKPRRGTTKIDQLRALILAGGHLRDPAKGITLANLRTQGRWQLWSACGVTAASPA